MIVSLDSFRLKFLSILGRHSGKGYKQIGRNLAILIVWHPDLAVRRASRPGRKLERRPNVLFD
jgi:hypothetical protein